MLKSNQLAQYFLSVAVGSGPLRCHQLGTPNGQTAQTCKNRFDLDQPLLNVISMTGAPLPKYL